MTKKKTTKKTFRKPQVGDTVFIKGETKYCAWYYKEKIEVEGKEYAHCITIIPKLDGNNNNLEDNFPIDILTLEPPSESTSILIG